jgi:hypothetical protein
MNDLFHSLNTTSQASVRRQDQPEVSSNKKTVLAILSYEQCHMRPASKKDKHGDGTNF